MLKPKDVLSILKLCLGGTIPLVAFLWFHFYSSPPGPDHDSTKEVIATICNLIFYVVCIFYLTSIAARIGKADGLAIGYFYNFIYETNVFVQKSGEMHLGAEEIDYKADDINYLVIIPDNLHAYYLISDVLRTTFLEVKIAPPGGITSRTITWQWFKFMNDGKEKQVLIDIPTTLRTLRFYREEAHGVNHYVSLSDLQEDTKEQVMFERVRRKLKKDIKLFSDSLDTILKKESLINKNPRFDKMITIIYTSELIKEIFTEEKLKKIDGLSNNKDDKFKAEQEFVKEILLTDENRDLIAERIKTAILKNGTKPNPWYYGIIRLFHKLNPFPSD